MSDRTIARLYDSYQDAAQAVHDLQAVGIPHEDISLIANNADNRTQPEKVHEGNESGSGAEIGAGLGALAGGGVGVLTGLGMLAIPGVGPVVAAGWLIALVAGAASGAVAGGLLGGLVGAGVSREHAEVFAEGVRRGGTVLTVRMPEERVAQVETIMDRNAADPVARRELYASEGWTGYDFDAPALTPAERERETALRDRIGRE
jgi:hypothetical protein